MQVNDVVFQSGDRLGFSPSLGFRGPIDETVTGQAAVELLAAAKALLAAVPADATSAEVHVEVDEEVRLLLQYDSGTPVDPTTSKIVGEYVQQAGGRLTIETTADGTRLTWSVPLPGVSDT